MVHVDVKCGFVFLLLLITKITVAFRSASECRGRHGWRGCRKVQARPINDGDVSEATDAAIRPLVAPWLIKSIVCRTTSGSAKIMHSWLSIMLAVSTWQLAVVPPVAASTATSPLSSLPALAIILPGFLLQPGQYESYADALRKADIPTWIQSDDATDTANDNTAAALHRDAAAVLARNTKHASAVLIGHSRGGAVAAIAATALNGMKTPPLLVLLDPVDTTPPTALPLISTPTSTTRPPPVLVVSLPYGGYSSFYKTYYESACAPVLRNGDSFALALSQRSPSQRVLQVVLLSISYHERVLSFGLKYLQCLDARSLLVVSTCFSSLSQMCLVCVDLPDAGHTQLLDDRPDSAAASVCAANGAVRDADVRSFLQEVIVRWVTTQRGGSPVDAADLEAFVQEMTRLHPQVHLTYRIW
jgi:hypothetical protein